MTYKQLESSAIAEWEALEDSDSPRIYIGTATCCRNSGALDVLDRINAELKEKNIDARVIEVGCMGDCYLEPVVAIARRRRPRIVYGQVTQEIASQLIKDCIIDDNPRTDLALGSIGSGDVDSIPSLWELPLFKSQVRIALRNCGYIDPENINHYIAQGGYSGLARALEMGPEKLIEEISRSGLRGRGGSGFPTGNKWRYCQEASGNEKYMICNAHEGDPGAYMGRAILESDPHSVLEGMLIGACATGATHGYIYISEENTLAIDRIHSALQQMRDKGLLGKNILDSSLDFDIEIKEGAPDFICGEETAMIRSMEGRRAMPWARPPFPATSGLGGKPTCINNVETLANVPAILQNGAEWYAGYGTESSKGTKTFILGGKVKHTGLIEVPMNTTLRQIIYDIGGGMQDDNEFKVALVGGPTGGFLTESALDIPVDYEHLTEEGAIIGSGTITVADSNSCMVDLAKNSMSFTQGESCGECVLCREGTIQMLEILTDISEGKSKSDDIDVLVDLGNGMKIGSLCALGRTAPCPVLTAIEHYRDEYEAHIKKKQCPAKVCQKISA